MLMAEVKGPAEGRMPLSSAIASTTNRSNEQTGVTMNTGLGERTGAVHCRCNLTLSAVR